MAGTLPVRVERPRARLVPPARPHGAGISARRSMPPVRSLRCAVQDSRTCGCEHNGRRDVACHRTAGRAPDRDDRDRRRPYRARADVCRGDGDSRVHRECDGRLLLRRRCGVDPVRASGLAAMGRRRLAGARCDARGLRRSGRGKLGAGKRAGSPDRGTHHRLCAELAASSRGGGSRGAQAREERARVRRGGHRDRIVDEWHRRTAGADPRSCSGCTCRSWRRSG